MSPAVHSYYNPFKIAVSLIRGKSLYRSLLNCALEKLECRGRVLDLGSKTTDASYHDHLRCTAEVQITCTDLRAGAGVLLLDVEKPFPVSDASFDTVLAFNLFEHVWQFQVAPAEIFRILGAGGRVIIAVPFMHEYHADPDDYVRFTDTGLRAYWESAGFLCEHMEALGEGLLTMAFTKVAAQVVPGKLHGLVSAVFYLLAAPLDRVVALRPRVDGRTVPQRFALGFLAVFAKPK